MLNCEQKKEAHSEEYAHLYAYHSVTNTHMIEMCRVLYTDTPTIKMCLYYVLFVKW